MRNSFAPCDPRSLLNIEGQDVVATLEHLYANLENCLKFYGQVLNPHETILLRNAAKNIWAVKVQAKCHALDAARAS